MKTTSLYALLGGLVLSAAAQAQPNPPDHKAAKPGDHGQRRAHAAETWKTADANSDGFLTAEEFATLRRIARLPEEKRSKIFERLDKNGDGKLADKELAVLARKRKPDMKRLWELDKDKSGGISFDEMKAGEAFAKLPAERQERIFKRLDQNGDGQITKDDRPEKGRKPERKRKPGDGGGRGNPQEMLRELDENKDGALSFDEFRKGDRVKSLDEDEQEDRFQKLDKNHDKKLSREDFQPAAPDDPKPVKD
ncbi:MAG: EF-hand domain-containing protein [Verrucomicrobiota bacterium]